MLAHTTLHNMGSIRYSGRELRQLCTRVEHDNTLTLMNLGAVKNVQNSD